MLGEHTENDLSYNHTKLDYMAMKATAEIALGHSCEAISKHLTKLRQRPVGTHTYLHAQWLLREAQALAVVAETLVTLTEGLSREELEIVNKKGGE